MAGHRHLASYRRTPAPVQARDAALARLRTLNRALAIAAVVLVIAFGALAADATTAQQRARSRVLASATAQPTVTARTRAVHHHRRHHRRRRAATPTAAPAATAAPTAVATPAATPVPTQVATPAPTAQAPVVTSGGS